MSREDLIEVQGKVLDNLPQGKFLTSVNIINIVNIINSYKLY